MPLLFWPPSQPFKAPKPPRLEPREMVGTWESSAGAAQAAPAAAAAASADKDPSFDWEPAVCCYSASHSHTVPRNRSLAFAVSAQAQRFLLHICGRRRAGVACQSRKSLQVCVFQLFSHPFYHRIISTSPPVKSGQTCSMLPAATAKTKRMPLRLLVK